MIIHRFLHWINEAPEGARAEGAGALARAYLYSDLSAEEREAAEAALTLLIQDTSPDVRRAVADALATSASTPHHIALTLADDIEEVAICMIGLSPVLTDADLIDLAATGKLFVLLAIAHRSGISPGVAAALAELGDEETCLLLIKNPGALLTPSVFTRLAERFGHHAPISEALIQREGIPVTVRQTIMMKMAHRLSTLFAGRTGQSLDSSQNLARETCDRATLALAREEDCDLPALVRHLRHTSQLTSTLVLRALLSGNMRLFEEMLAQLTGLPLRRVSGLVQDISGRGFAALFVKSGLPLSSFAAFSAALTVWHNGDTPAGGGTALHKEMVQQALAACRVANHDDLDELCSLLQRFSDEAIREEALNVVADLKGRPVELPHLKPSPQLQAA